MRRWLAASSMQSSDILKSASSCVQGLVDLVG